MCTDYKIYAQKAILKYLIGLRNFPCGTSNVTALFHFSFFVLVVFGLLLNRNWIHKGFPRLTETLFGKIRILNDWKCVLCFPSLTTSGGWKYRAAENGCRATIWAAGVEKLYSAGELWGRGGEHKLYFLIRCWHCLWLWIVTGGCIYGVGTGRRVFVKLHPHSAIINTANWLTVWFQLVMFLPWSLIYCSACAVVVETAVRLTQCSCFSWSYMEICKMTGRFFFIYTSPKIYYMLNLFCKSQ